MVAQIDHEIRQLTIWLHKKKEAGVKVISPEKSYEDIFIQIHGGQKWEKSAKLFMVNIFNSQLKRKAHS
jgi:hypothetical protein